MKTLIRGNTFPVKEQLKKLGCRWNGDEKAWVAFTPEAAKQAQAIVDAAGPKTWDPSNKAPVGAPGRAQTSQDTQGRVTSPDGVPDAYKPVLTDPPGVVWSDEQLGIFRAAEQESGHVVVEALAGTGKTFTATYMFPRIRGERGSYVVFNRKNKEEAQAKILDPRVEIKTHNGFGFMFVRMVWPKAKPTDDVEHDRVERAVGKDTAQEVKTAVFRLVGFLKNTFVQPSLEDAVECAQERSVEAQGFEEPENGGWTVQKLAQAALRVLELSLERDPENRISFNDQVWLAVRMDWVRAWFDFVVVDECQDMNVPQLIMVRRAVKPGGRIFVIGDRNQAIYGFRGAASDGMDYMVRELQARVLGLTITRRCGKAIVREANAFVPHYRAADDAREGLVTSVPEQAVVDEVRPGDAVLSRVNAPLMSMCLKLIRRGVPARIQGRNIGDNLKAVVRKLKARNVPHLLQKLEAWAGKQKKRFAGTKIYEAKCEEINDTFETLQAVAEGSASVGEVEDRIGRIFADEGQGQVVLSSVHKAKGLEWDKVYLLRRTFNRKRPAGAKAPSANELREERNIQYVAITRAKNHLVWAEEVGGAGHRG